MLGRLAGVVVSIAVVVALAACHPLRGVDFEPGDLDVPACEGTEAVPVGRLADDVWVGCSLAGREVVFPSGWTWVAPELGGVSVSGSSTEGEFAFALFNLGRYGMVASRTAESGESSEWWGPPEGIELQQSATGEIGPTLWG